MSRAAAGNGSQPSALDEWEAESLPEVELPSGRRVRGRLPDAGYLLSRELLPTHLRGLALQISTHPGTAAALADKKRGDELREYQKLAICFFVEEVWSRSRERWEPTTLTPARLDRLDRRDIATLGDVVLRLRSPAQVTAQSRWNRGEMDGDAYQAIYEKEAPATVLGWLEFRRQRLRPAGSPDGPDVGGEAEQPRQPEAPRPTRGVRPRRSPSGARPARRGR